MELKTSAEFSHLSTFTFTTGLLASVVSLLRVYLW